MSIIGIYEFVCDDLGIEDKPSIEHINSEMNRAYYKGETNTIELNTEMPILDQMFIIAHELRHVYQMQNDMYDMESYKQRDNVDLTEYNLQPIEIDAHAYAYKVMCEVYGMRAMFEGLDNEVINSILERAESITLNFED